MYSSNSLLKQSKHRYLINCSYHTVFVDFKFWLFGLAKVKHSLTKNLYTFFFSQNLYNLVWFSIDYRQRFSKHPIYTLEEIHWTSHYSKHIHNIHEIFPSRRRNESVLRRDRNDKIPPPRAAAVAVYCIHTIPGNLFYTVACTYDDAIVVLEQFFSPDVTPP